MISLLNLVMKDTDNMKIIDKQEKKKKIIAVVTALFFGRYVLVFSLCPFSNASFWSLHTII